MLLLVGGGHCPVGPILDPAPQDRGRSVAEVRDLVVAGLERRADLVGQERAQRLRCRVGLIERQAEILIAYLVAALHAMSASAPAFPRTAQIASTRRALVRVEPDVSIPKSELRKGSSGASFLCEALAFVFSVRLVACANLCPRGRLGGCVGAGEVDLDALLDRWHA